MLLENAREISLNRKRRWNLARIVNQRIIHSCRILRDVLRNFFAHRNNVSRRLVAILDIYNTWENHLRFELLGRYVYYSQSANFNNLVNSFQFLFPFFLFTSATIIEIAFNKKEDIKKFL